MKPGGGSEQQLHTPQNEQCADGKFELPICKPLEHVASKRATARTVSQQPAGTMSERTRPVLS